MHFILGSKDNILPLIRFAKLAIWRSRKKGFGFVIYAGTNQARINIKQGTFYFILVCKDGIFVRGLSTMTTVEDIRNCFEPFCQEHGGGEIKEITLLKEKHCLRIRPYGFFTVDSKETVDKICRREEFVVKTKTVRVEPARTRNEMLKKQGEYLYCI